MILLKLKEVDSEIVSKLLKKIFIYPTDTIYGIGCNAEDKQLVEKIRKIKGREEKPFSIIAPNLDYILKYCKVQLGSIKKYLPGPYTLILKKKNNKFLQHVSDTEYMGVRIPSNEFTKILQKTGKPIITTSVNLSGEKPFNSIKEINKKILNKVDFVIDAGVLSGKPSKLVKDGKVIER